MSEVQDGSEEVVPRHRPDVRAHRLWTVTTGGATLGGLGAVGVGLAVAGWPWWPLVLLLPVATPLAVGYAHLHWCHRWWARSEQALEVGHGVVFRRASSVPYHRIQQIDVDRDVLERVIGLATLTVHTASATTDASIPGLALDDARALRRHLLARAGRDDGV